ncbi:MAG: flippase-like domain-containing protein [Lentisphaerae bacterium]|nr:flippase-like domain-containing protein [Lentisphaerota bacterium]
MKQRLAALTQLIIGAGILTVIILKLERTGQLQDLLAAWRSSMDHGVLLAIGFGSFGLCLALCTLRWHLILRAQGFGLSRWLCAELYLVGQFFNAFMLGATGGDLVKAWYAARHTPDRKTEIVATIFIDRIVGLLAIVVLAPVAMLLRLPIFWSHPESRLLVILMSGLMIGTMVIVLIVFRRNLFARWPWLDRLTQRHAIGRTMRRVYDAFQLVLGHRGLLSRTLGLSALNHLIAVVGTMAYGRAAGLSMGPIDYLAAFLSINLISAIPITPSGIGTRETAALMLLGALGVAHGQAVSVTLMLFGSLLVWSLVGGIVYAAFVWRGHGRPETAVPTP